MSAVVETTSGRIEGRDKRGVLLFAGVPYAAPPTGDRRYRPPVPPEPWTGVREAHRFGPVAPQGGGAASLLTQGWNPETSEDCLTLNVQTPGADGGRRPVMVWIHGGGFTSGTGATPWYDGASFAADGDVVAVTINYRLGALGFLHLGSHHEDFPDTGNLGLLDQIAALEWVRDNIASFGGDPGNVTIYGESAGGMSVATLLGTPRAAGLFHRAIAQSGTAHGIRSADQAAGVTQRMLAALDARSVDDLLVAPAERLVEAQNAVADELQRTGSVGDGLGLPFFPVVDGVVLPEPPLDATRGGLNGDVPLVTGTTRDEFNLFLVGRPDDLDGDRVRKLIGRVHDDPDRVLETYRQELGDPTPRAVFSAFMTDRIFTIPSLRLAEAHAAHQPNNTFVYQFRWATPAFDGMLGSCHALEIPFVFDTIDRRGTELLLGSDPPTNLARAMHGAWTAFAHTGRPVAEGLLDWRPHADGRAVAWFDETVELVGDPFATRLDLFSALR